MNIEALHLHFYETSVLDDNKFFTKILSSMLQRNNYLNVNFHNTVDSFFKNFSDKTDIVILDYFLVGTDGLNILRKIKRKKPDCMVIMMSDAIGKEVAIKSLNLGAWKYVDKSEDGFDRKVLGFLIKAQRILRERDRERDLQQKDNYRREQLKKEIQSFLDKHPPSVNDNTRSSL